MFNTPSPAGLNCTCLISGKTFSHGWWVKLGVFLSVLLCGTSASPFLREKQHLSLLESCKPQLSPHEMETLEGRTEGMAAERSVALGKWGFLSQHQLVPAVSLKFQSTRSCLIPCNVSDGKDAKQTPEGKHRVQGPCCWQPDPLASPGNHQGQPSSCWCLELTHSHRAAARTGSTHQRQTQTSWIDCPSHAHSQAEGSQRLPQVLLLSLISDLGEGKELIIEGQLRRVGCTAPIDFLNGGKMCKSCGL